MYFRLSLRNIKRSISDYFIYFLTLDLSVCIFYVFNSISYEKTTINLSKVQRQLLTNFSTYISITSILLSFVLGFLIIYANNFMIKKRKKEFGMYLSLGMGKRHISLILLYEILIIGIISLITGLLLGVILSQGLGALTAKLFIVELSVYKFVFSVESMVKTIVYFGIMFFLVILFNLFFVSRHKLIELLNCSKKSKKLRINNMYILAVLFLISILCIISAYYLILQNGISNINKRFFICIVLGFIGTFLFFLSLPRLALKFMMKYKKLYLKNLNVFIIRQLNNNINTAFILMTVICVMLSLTTTILSTALTIKGAFEKNIDFVTPYDVSLSINTAQRHSVAKTLKELGFNIDNFSVEYTEYYEYNTSIMFKSIIKNAKSTSIKREYGYLMNTFIPSIKISDYNKLAKMQKLKELELNNDEVLFLSNFKVFKPILNEFIKNNTYLKINGIDFRIKSDVTIYKSIETTISPISYLTLILPDDAVKASTSRRSIVSMNYIGDKRKIEQTVIDAYDNKYKIDDTSKISISGVTKIMSAEANNGVSVLAIYLSLYIGLVFMITSAAVLALKLLSEATENVKKYTLLKKMGVDDRMINQSILFQLFFYFVMPLLLALLHSIVGIIVITKELSSYEIQNILPSSLFIAIILCLIYGSYFAVTYKEYKNIISNINS